MRTWFVVAVLFVGLALAGGTAAGQPGTPLDGNGATSAAVDEGNNSNVSNESVGFGSSVSSFLQSTAAETNTAVDQGIWKANVGGNATAEEAKQRAARLGERVAELRTQRARLAELRSNGSISLPTYVARDARMRTELRSLGAAANRTQQVAPNTTGVQQSLASVEQAANAASGPPDEITNRTGASSELPGVGNGPASGETPANAPNGNGQPSDLEDTPSNEAGKNSDGAGNGADGAGNGNEGAGTGKDDSGTDGTGNGGADDSGGSSSNSAGSSGAGSNSDSSNTGTTGDSSSGSDGSSASSSGSSDAGADGSADLERKTQSNAQGNPGPKSD